MSGAIEEALPKMGTREYDRLVNEKHISDPQPGDYWQEMFCPYFVVIRRLGDLVIICDQKKDAGDHRWTWDLTKLKVQSLAELRKQVTYGTIPGFVADVCPAAHLWVVDEVGDSATIPLPPKVTKQAPQKCSHCNGTGTQP